MRAKEYLRQIKKYDSIIRNKNAEILHWKDIATNISSKMSGERVQTSGSKQRIEEAVVNYTDIEKELAKEAQIAYRRRREIVSLIENVSGDEYEVLYDVYVLLLSLDECACKHDRSLSWVNSLHGTGLKKIQDMLDKM